jgi:chromate transporter
MFILWGLSLVYAAYGSVPWIAAIFYGLKPAVLAIVAAAVIRIGQKALKGPVMWAIATAAFIGIFFLALPFPIIVLGALIFGLVWGSLSREPLGATMGHASPAGASLLDDDTDVPEHTRPSWSRAAKVLAIGVALWWLPILLVGAWQGWNGTLFQAGLFFSKAADGDLRRRVCGVAVRRATGGRQLRLATDWADDGWPRSGRNNARAADHGPAIRRVHGRLAAARRASCR